MKRLDKLSLGILGQTLGEDKDHPAVASPTLLAPSTLPASSTDAPQTLFDAPCQTLVYLGPAVRQEQDHSSSESVSRELPLGCHYMPCCKLLL